MVEVADLFTSNKVVDVGNVFIPLGINFINFLQAFIALADPENMKKSDNLAVFFVLLGSAHVKAACKMLMTMTP